MVGKDQSWGHTHENNSNFNYFHALIFCDCLQLHFSCFIIIQKRVQNRWQLSRPPAPPAVAI